MNVLQKKCLKKAIKLFCNLPVNDWYNQAYIEQINIGYHSAIIRLDQYDIEILVKCESLINGKPILDVSFIRSINGTNEYFKCYETAYNYVDVN
jgi:hypothetical protein